MGCRSWYYSKIERTKKEAVAIKIAELSKSISELTLIANGEYRTLINSAKNEKEKTEFENKIHHFLNRLKTDENYLFDIVKRIAKNKQRLEKGKDLFYAYCFHPEIKGKTVKYCKGKFFVATEWHNGWRVGWMPGEKETKYNYYCEVYLYSRKQTFNFIKNQQKRKQKGLPHWPIFLYNLADDGIDSIEYINRFWDKYPNGLIYFG